MCDEIKALVCCRCSIRGLRGGAAIHARGPELFAGASEPRVGLRKPYRASDGPGWCGLWLRIGF